MAIIRQRGLQLTVATIADRNAIVKRPEHLVVHVDDAIADLDAGAGPAVYRWSNSSGGVWILISAGAVRTMSFSTEEHLIQNGEVIADNVPANDHIWDIQILDGDNVIGYPRVEDLNISAGVIGNIVDFDGYKLRYTYAYGTLTTQIQTALDAKATLYESTVDPLTVDGNKIKAGDFWHDLNTEGKIAICLTIAGTLTWLEI